MSTTSLHPAAATETLANLASTGTSQQLAPPYSGTDGGIQRRRLYPPQTPPYTWMAVRINLEGQIVAQLGSKPAPSNQFPAIVAAYQFTQTVPAGNHFWNAALRTISVSRLPRDRAFAYGFMNFSAHPYTAYQELVPGQTHLFSAGQYMLPAGTYRITCGVLVSLQFGAGQTAYAEAIAKLESLVRVTPFWGAEDDAATARAADDPVSRLITELTPQARLAGAGGDARQEEMIGGLD